MSNTNRYRSVRRRVDDEVVAVVIDTTLGVETVVFGPFPDLFVADNLANILNRANDGLERERLEAIPTLGR